MSEKNLNRIPKGLIFNTFGFLDIKCRHPEETCGVGPTLG